VRILGFSQKWDKLLMPEFITFRFARKDKDWQPGETVQIVYKPRSHDRQVLGIAEIISKETRFIPQDAWVRPRASYGINFPELTHSEAIKDGFSTVFAMIWWLQKNYGRERLIDEPMNKLTLRYRNRRIMELTK